LREEEVEAENLQEQTFPELLAMFRRTREQYGNGEDRHAAGMRIVLELARRAQPIMVLIRHPDRAPQYSLADLEQMREMLAQLHAMMRLYPRHVDNETLARHHNAFAAILRQKRLEAQYTFLGSARRSSRLSLDTISEIARWLPRRGDI
jgi:hypothetical protein